MEANKNTGIPMPDSLDIPDYESIRDAFWAQFTADVITFKILERSGLIGAAKLITGGLKI